MATYLWISILLAAAAGAVAALIFRRWVPRCIQWFKLYVMPGRRLKHCGVRRAQKGQMPEWNSDVR